MSVYDIVHVSLVDGCNLHCRWCAVPDSFTFIKLDELRATVEALNRHVTGVRHLRLIGSGEGLLHPEFGEALSIFRELTAPAVSREVWTNGTRIRRHDMEALFGLNLVTWLMFSFDGYGDRESYEHIRRGARFDSVVENVRQACSVRDALGSRTRVGVSAIVPHEGAVPFPHVADDEVRRRFEKEVFPFVDQVLYRGLIDWNGVVEVEGLPTAPGTIGPCRTTMRPELVVDARGFVHPCCRDISLQIPLGNIHTESLDDIARRREGHFGRLARGERVPGCESCSACRYGEPNEELSALLADGRGLFTRELEAEIRERPRGDDDGVDSRKAVNGRSAFSQRDRPGLLRRLLGRLRQTRRIRTLRSPPGRSPRRENGLGVVLRVPQLPASSADPEGRTIPVSRARPRAPGDRLEDAGAVRRRDRLP